MYNTLLTNIENGIFTITINRPDKLNALNKVVLDELDTVMDTVYKDENIKGVIITGEGPKAFVAGADISEFLAIPPHKGSSFAENGQRIFFKIE
ncbi:MAG: enoyl-CoA hydratase-related protein, partial [Ginsengibacter sp.]